MTIEAKQAAIAADYRRYEAYTALWPEEEYVKLENEIGKIKMVMRPEVENPTELLELSKNNLVALLIVGDPFKPQPMLIYNFNPRRLVLIVWFFMEFQ